MPSGISFGTIASSMAAAAASAIITESMKSTPKAAEPPPQVEAPTAIPTVDTAANAKQKSIMAQMQRQGRASTILTSGNASTTDAMG